MSIGDRRLAPSRCYKLVRCLKEKKLVYDIAVLANNILKKLPGPKQHPLSFGPCGLFAVLSDVEDMEWWFWWWWRSREGRGHGARFPEMSDVWNSPCAIPHIPAFSHAFPLIIIPPPSNFLIILQLCFVHHVSGSFSYWPKLLSTTSTPHETILQQRW